jgi:hypothetical protein
MGRQLTDRELQVQPVRYLDEFPSFEGYLAKNYFTARKTSPFRIGDVIRVGEGIDALVVGVVISRVFKFDPLSPIWPLCKVRKVTKKGSWSMAWTYAWPGEIEEAYRIPRPAKMRA